MSFVSLSIYPVFNKQVLLRPFYKCRNWGSERFVNRSKVTQLSTLNLDLIQIQISPTLKLKFLAMIHSGHRQRRKYYFHLSLPPSSFLPASLLKKEVGGEGTEAEGWTDNTLEPPPGVTWSFSCPGEGLSSYVETTLSHSEWESHAELNQ